MVSRARLLDQSNYIVSPRYGSYWYSDFSFPYNRSLLQPAYSHIKTTSRNKYLEEHPIMQVRRMRNRLWLFRCNLE
jgi:hypothetical protein